MKLAYDDAGHSAVTPDRVTMREYAADVEELLDGLGIARAAIVGLSMGGLVAMDLAAFRPDRYWAIGLVATTVQPPTAEDQATRLERAAAVDRDGIGVLVDYMHTGLYGPACRPLLAGLDLPALVCAGSAPVVRRRRDS